LQKRGAERAPSAAIKENARGRSPQFVSGRAGDRIKRGKAPPKISVHKKSPPKTNHIYFCSKHKNKKKLKHNKPYKKKISEGSKKMFHLCIDAQI